MELRDVPETEADGHTERQMGEDTTTNERKHAWSATEKEKYSQQPEEEIYTKSPDRAREKRELKKKEDAEKAPEQKEQLGEEKRTDNENTAQEPTYKITLIAPATERDSTDATPGEEETGLQSPTIAETEKKQTSKRQRGQRNDQ